MSSPERSEGGRVFADAAGRKQLWTQALLGWNMRQSSVVNEWGDEGRRLERREILEVMLTTKFGTLTDASLETLRAMSDDHLKALSLQLLTAASLAELGL